MAQMSFIFAECNIWNVYNFKAELLEKWNQVGRDKLFLTFPGNLNLINVKTTLLGLFLQNPVLIIEMLTSQNERL